MDRSLIAWSIVLISYTGCVGEDPALGGSDSDKLTEAASEAMTESTSSSMSTDPGSPSDTTTSSSGSTTEGASTSTTEEPSTSTTDGSSTSTTEEPTSTSADEPICINGTTQPCYSGPEGTEGVGTCVAGVATCVDGEFLDCVGEILPSYDLCSTDADEDCDGKNAICSGQPLWGKSIGGVLYDYIYGGAWTSDGALYLGGASNSWNTNFDGVIIDSTKEGQAFIARYNGDSTLAWVKTLGVIPNTGLWNRAAIDDVAADSADRAVVIGTMRAPGTLATLGEVAPGPFIAAFASDGALMWINHFPHSGSISAKLATLDDDRIAIHGSYSSSGPDFGGGPLAELDSHTRFYAVFSADGAHIKSQAFAGGAVNTRSEIAPLPGGGFVLAGSRGAPFDLGEGPEPNPNISPESANKLYVIHFDSGGGVEKNWSYPAGYHQSATIGAIDDGDFMLVTRGSNLNFGAGAIGGFSFVVRLGPDGIEKARWTGGVASLGTAAIARDGSVAIAGTHDKLSMLPGEQVPPPNERPRTFVITLDPSLSWRWTQIGYTDPVWHDSASPFFLAHEAKGRVAVGGRYLFRLTFDTIFMETLNKTQTGWVVVLDQ